MSSPPTPPLFSHLIIANNSLQEQGLAMRNLNPSQDSTPGFKYDPAEGILLPSASLLVA